MNNIGFGITCFGEEIYFKGTQNKLQNLLEKGHCCYVLTDNSDFFLRSFDNENLKLIPYKRNYISYHDKISLVKDIHEKHDIAILIDADLHIKDFSVFDRFTKYQFLDGVSYIDTLSNHPANIHFVGDIPMSGIEWLEYYRYGSVVYPNMNAIEPMWEYILVFNRDGFKSDDFFNDYEKLQVVKEFCDVRMRKDIVGAAEGISIAISCLKNGIPIQKDLKLESLLKNVITPITRHTPEDKIPEYLKSSS
jgi:hypothetical protein